MGLNMPRCRSRKLDLLVPVPRQGLLKATMGHFGGLFNVARAWDPGRPMGKYLAPTRRGERSHSRSAVRG